MLSRRDCLKMMILLGWIEESPLHMHTEIQLTDTGAENTEEAQSEQAKVMMLPAKKLVDILHRKLIRNANCFRGGNEREINQLDDMYELNGM